MSVKRKAASILESNSSAENPISSNKEKNVSSQKTSKPNTKATKAKSSITTTSQLKKTISDFLLSKSRPYPLTELLITFKKEGTKADIIKVLDNLSSENVLIRKEFKKAVLYLCSREPSNINEDELVSLKEDLLKKTESLNEVKRRKELLKGELAELCKYPTNDEMIKIVKMKTKEAIENKKRLEDLTAGNIKVSKTEMEAINKELGKYRKVLKERKSIFKNIFDTLLEKADIKKNDLMEEVGLEER